ncbi:hypothetical protein [Adhaeribacter rhizoryzae]|uniref:Uncharacterized protein n=1 Tax=Adhaeribacter rhizoryzae TaxID=2607907 RepID=A0A5M6DLL8_9BACT|nr:hypothetical protein [Adhaeribacter rhizoryzae]KAA5548431.1 hypothetical protein F0145_06810 [Adhaeribacter rhizoryzae]
MDTTKLLIVAWKKLPPPKEHPNDRIKISVSLDELEHQEEVTRSGNADNAGLGDSSHQIEFYKKEQNGEIIWEVGNIS